MSLEVSKSKFKAKALEYLRNVEQRGEVLVITDHGRPVVKVVPFTTDVEDMLAPFRGSLTVYHDPTEPVAAGDWEALE